MPSWTWSTLIAAASTSVIWRRGDFGRITRGFPWPAAGTPEPEFAPGEGVIGQVALAKSPLLVVGLDAVTPEQRAYAQALGMESFHAQPSWRAGAASA